MDWMPLGKLISDILTENKLIEYLAESQQINTLEACAGKSLNAKNLKKMKIIDNIKKDPTIATKEVITSRRVPLTDFPLFSQIDASPKIIARYLEACKMDGSNPKLNICDMRQLDPEVVLKKSRKRKVAGEGSSQKVPKAAKKKGNPSFIFVVESMILSTSETPSSPKPTEDPSPQTFDDFDIEFDPSLTLENILNKPHSTTSHLDQNQPELAQVLSDIDQFDPEFQAPHIENLNSQAPNSKNSNVHAPQP
ncbi:unnamed protein product [Vicia faba]|uniref:Uncharacterized protein n=1 Tax=Vicia faba TaxID=3906 RepID=A0AAV0Z098_VICFA|nr:unnamed protein product [Vicia faba]